MDSKYYYQLGRVGSYWGRLKYDIINEETINEKTYCLKTIDTIRDLTSKYVMKEQEKEHIQIYDMASPIVTIVMHYMSKMVLLSLFGYIVSIPICAFCFYMPLHYINTQPPPRKSVLVSSAKSFRVTENMIKGVVEESKTFSAPEGKPSPPTGLWLIN